MLDESSSEHLQPMKEKMEQFINKVQQLMQTLKTKFTSTQEQFNKVLSNYIRYSMNLSNCFMQVVQYYSVVPKPNEDHVTISHFFSLWSKFSHDLKKEWQHQQKQAAKQRASSMRRDKSMVLKKPVVTGGLVRVPQGS